MLDLKILNKVGEVEKQAGQSVLSLLSRVPFGNVLTALSLNTKINDEMVHDAWAMVRYNDGITDFHSSMIPFNLLSQEVQELDKSYVEKLNEVLDYFKGLRKLSEVSNAAK